jgi:crossover junction endodeoxyribonuclease RuvC
MRVLGIDPGINGAIALYDTDTLALDVLDVPILKVMTSTRKSRSELDVASILQIVLDLAPDRAFIEQVAAMPGQGVVSMFRFGDAFGVLRGVVTGAQIPLDYVRPQEWQKLVRMPKGDDAGRLRVNQLFPKSTNLFKRKLDHNRADAALIAYAGSIILKEISKHPLTD